MAAGYESEYVMSMAWNLVHRILIFEENCSNPNAIFYNKYLRICGSTFTNNASRASVVTAKSFFRRDSALSRKN